MHRWRPEKLVQRGVPSHWMSVAPEGEMATGVARGPGRAEILWMGESGSHFLCRFEEEG